MFKNEQYETEFLVNPFHINLLWSILNLSILNLKFSSKVVSFFEPEVATVIVYPMLFKLLAKLNTALLKPSIFGKKLGVVIKIFFFS